MTKELIAMWLIRFGFVTVSMLIGYAIGKREGKK